MKRIPKRGLVWLTVALTVAGAGLLTSDVTGQTGSSKKTARKTAAPASPNEVRQLELRTKQALDQFVKDTVALALEYEQAGLLEQSKQLLQTLQRVDDKLPGVKEKIEQLNETILSENPSGLEVDVSKGWGDAVARVQAGRPFRIQAEGSYRFTVQATVGPAGFPTEDPARDLAKGVPCGALMALIIPVDDQGRPGKPGAPIEVGDGREINPKENGLLFLSVNAPNGHKSTGKLTVQLSGYVTTAKSGK